MVLQLARLGVGPVRPGGLADAAHRVALGGPLGDPLLPGRDQPRRVAPQGLGVQEGHGRRGLGALQLGPEHSLPRFGDGDQYQFAFGAGVADEGERPGQELVLARVGVQLVPEAVLGGGSGGGVCGPHGANSTALCGPS